MISDLQGLILMHVLPTPQLKAFSLKACRSSLFPLTSSLPPLPLTSIFLMMLRSSSATLGLFDDG
jgi:hypothetical protein